MVLPSGIVRSGPTVGLQKGSRSFTDSGCMQGKQGILLPRRLLNPSLAFRHLPW